MAMNRQLFSGEKACLSNCAYCFAKWSDYKKQPNMETCQIGPGKTIIYPCCDSDINENLEIIHRLWKIAESGSEIYVSISTKRAIPNKRLEQYGKLNRYLQENKKGFVKISVSITTKYRIEDIEPGTDNYEKRKALFGQLQQQGFFTSLVFKPVLPFIADEEYAEIVADFPTCEYFLLGGLYVDPGTDFYQAYIKGRYDVEKKKVSWLKEIPCWGYVSQDEKLSRIREYITAQGKKAFYSDMDLISCMSERTVF